MENIHLIFMIQKYINGIHYFVLRSWFSVLITFKNINICFYLYCTNVDRYNVIITIESSAVNNDSNSLYR